ncbi:MAG: hypothetical protein SPI77_06135 [Corynebacterium sp.]|nr:hypothetical protein [Corynebacterium sp.]
MAESPAGAERPNVFTSSDLSQAVKTGTASDAMWEAIWFGEVTDPKDLCPKMV